MANTFSQKEIIDILIDRHPDEILAVIATYKYQNPRGQGLKFLEDIYKAVCELRLKHVIAIEDFIAEKVK